MKYIVEVCENGKWKLIKDDYPSWEAAQNAMVKMAEETGKRCRATSKPS